MNQNRRESQRYFVDWAVEIRAGDQVLPARAKNASLGGLYLEMAAAPLLGDRVHLRFQVGAHTIEAAALVRWHSAEGIGLQFDGLRARDVYALGKYFEMLP